MLPKFKGNSIERSSREQKNDWIIVGICRLRKCAAGLKEKRKLQKDMEWKRNNLVSHLLQIFHRDMQNDGPPKRHQGNGSTGQLKMLSNHGRTPHCEWSCPKYVVNCTVTTGIRLIIFIVTYVAMGANVSEVKIKLSQMVNNDWMLKQKPTISDNPRWTIDECFTKIDRWSMKKWN